MKQQKQMKSILMINPCTLSVDKLQEFLATWRGPCREHSIEKVLESTVNYYTGAGTPKQRRKMINFFTLYHATGLLNVAVRSMGAVLSCP